MRRWLVNSSKSIIKITIIFLLTLFLPRLLIFWSKPMRASSVSLENFKLGLENISQKMIIDWKKRRVRIGLITNQTGVTQTGQRNIDYLKAKGLNIQAIFVPEHGLSGNIAAEKKVTNAIDSITNIVIRSLYKENGPREIDKKDIDDIDIFMFDIQDSGMRHYTYISTLYKVLEAATAFNKKIVVLDRPNPLGIMMEGPLVNDDLISFRSIASIPVRHGMTMGELALYFNNYCLKRKVNLLVIPMAHFKRDDGLKGKRFTFLSPNIKSLASCYGYSFLGLLGEIDIFDVGVGTGYAFQCILLPENMLTRNNWNKLARKLNAHGLKCALYRYYSKRKKKWYEGLKVNIVNINKFKGIQVLEIILDFLKDKNIAFSFSPYFDKSIGSKLFRDRFEKKISKDEYEKRIADDLKKFYHKVTPLLLYSPKPDVS